jgi:ABC-2 type transport system permease protein
VLLFPLFLLAINVSNLGGAVSFRGFPTRSYISFALAFPFVMGASFATLGAGMGLAQDMASGFLKRLALASVHEVALALGLLAGPVVVVIAQACAYVVVGLLAGATIATGATGVLAIIAFSGILGLSFGAVGLIAALRTGSPAGVQGLLPLLFAALFLSSMSLPRGLIEIPWFRDVANYNPVSYLIEAIRALVIQGWDAHALALGGGIAAGILVLGLVGAARALRTRLARA